ncbi:hypothetical protein [Streptomyces sp. NPDC048638]|uniref:hypothetical protein n=1 Tax=Streptomyces sp. NPDC048638 TaxID=3365580 RepID=UPI00371B5B6A
MMNDRLSEIERSFALRTWVPTQDEIALGEAFRWCHDSLEADPLPAAMPPLSGAGGRWLTQRLVCEERLVREVTQILPSWRKRLSGTPMLHLVETYTSAGRALAPYARRLLTAWESAPPADPPAHLVETEARRLSIDPREADGILRYHAARRWERQQLSERERELLDAPGAVIRSISSTIDLAVAAGTSA